MNLRRAIPADIPFLMAMERACATAAHWTDQQYLELPLAGSGAERLVLVAERTSEGMGASDAPSDRDTSVLGFLVARHLAPEWELENIVVAPGARRQGIGGRLLNALLSWARETSSEAMFLEVRESNQAARSLYEKADFRQTGRRKSYYAKPVEDAILYRRDLA